MSKVVKIFLRHGFTPVDINLFKLGTCIDFDCYIQRFNGYAILINAGTFLDEKMHKKLTTHKSQVFIGNQNYIDYKNYAIENKNKTNSSIHLTTLEEEIKNCADLKNILSKQTLEREKLKTIYFLGKNLLNAWFESEEKQALPLESVEMLVDNLIAIVNNHTITLSSFNDFIDNEYSLSAHSLNVAFFASLIGHKVESFFDDQVKLVLSAIYHDIGKYDINDAILEKPDFLTKEEFDLMKEHVPNSTKILIKNGLKDRIILNAIKHHHERFDGSGYPNRLDKTLISEYGQILAVCDVFDALITIKPYRGAYSTYNALNLIGKEYKDKLNMKYVNTLITVLN